MVSATKGIEPGQLKLMSAVLEETLPGIGWRRALRAEFRARRLSAPADGGRGGGPESRRRHRAVQGVFATPRFRVYSNTDVIGVELAGALKNVIAIAAGMLEGLGLGNNPRAALVTRGLAEMTRLGVALGGGSTDFRGAGRHGRPDSDDHGGAEPEPRAGVALAQGQSFAPV